MRNHSSSSLDLDVLYLSTCVVIVIVFIECVVQITAAGPKGVLCTCCSSVVQFFLS
mgnify:CR=1 FL=1